MIKFLLKFLPLILHDLAGFVILKLAEKQKQKNERLNLK